MESTLFTVLSTNEEATISGGFGDDYSINIGAAAGVGNIAGEDGTGKAKDFSQKKNVGRRGY
ncbi:hypothetical protein [Nostoc sp. ChiVER01]|uniref:hypothetical protein n=1 Tax=Nostoc sp. ChiVER01 TaxID=3075382 RepID=UPI002AD465C6|nr:hypothetical protein [Nostoc sp. ChiVER01]MDZ8222270.1 hypothetical protein [Nostoc sp. ChiVER01]